MALSAFETIVSICWSVKKKLKLLNILLWTDIYIYILIIDATIILRALISSFIFYLNFADVYLRPHAHLYLQYLRSSYSQFSKGTGNSHKQIKTLVGRLWLNPRGASLYDWVLRL